MMTIEWTHRDHLLSADALHRAATHDAEIMEQMVPVVRLAEVDDLLRKAVWAMEAIATDIAEDEYYYGMSPEELERKCQEHVKYQRAQAFLVSVAEWRKREGKR